MRHLVIVGPTASGKSKLAVDLARLLSSRGRVVEIVSVDSMAVYRGMDIGTAKPTAAERAEIAHHVIDVADPIEEYSVSRYQRDAFDALSSIEARGGRAVLVGGTGLYVDAVVNNLTPPGQWPEIRQSLEDDVGVDGRGLTDLYERLCALDPVAAGRIEASNARRVVRALEVCIGSGLPFSSFGPGLQQSRLLPDASGDGRTRTFRLVGLRVARPLLEARIKARYDEQRRAGFLDEVRALRDRHGSHLSRTARQALGYRELLAHLDRTDGSHGSDASGSLETALDEAIRRTVRFAKRQERWFRRDPRIVWYDVEVDQHGDITNSVSLAERVLADWSE